MPTTPYPFAGYPSTYEGKTNDGEKRFVVQPRSTGAIAANIRDMGVK